MLVPGWVTDLQTQKLRSWLVSGDIGPYVASFERGVRTYMREPAKRRILERMREKQPAENCLGELIYIYLYNILEDDADDVDMSGN